MGVLKRFPLDFQRNLTQKEKREEQQKLNQLEADIIGKYFFDQALNAPLISINGRLTRCQGRYFGENKIEISGYLCKASKLIEDYSFLEVVLKHELAHWYLDIQDKICDDGSPEFEQLLAKIGSKSSASTKANLQYTKPISSFGFQIESECRECGKKLYSSNKTNGKWLHKKCHGSIVDKYVVIVDSDFK